MQRGFSVRDLLARAAVQLHAAAVDAQTIAARAPNRRTGIYGVLDDQRSGVLGFVRRCLPENIAIAFQIQRTCDDQSGVVAEDDRCVATHSQIAVYGHSRVCLNDIDLLCPVRAALNFLGVLAGPLNVIFIQTAGLLIDTVHPIDARARSACAHGQQTDTEHHCQQQRDKPLLHDFLLIVRAVGLPGFYIKIPL